MTTLETEIRTDEGDQGLAEKTSLEAWDKIDVNRVRDVSWFNVPGVSNYISSLTEAKPIHELIRPYFKYESRLTGAAIACGDMVGERLIFDQFDFVCIDGYDISSQSLARASQSFSETKAIFNAKLGDINMLKLPQNKYDLILGWHGIHHVKEIDYLFIQIENSLTEYGLFVMYEWIGPKYLQFPFMNRFISRCLLKLFFNKNERITHEGRLKGRWLQPSPDEFEPSEAVNSVRIYPMLLERFNIKKMILFGGLLYPMFEGLGDNSELKNKAGIAKKVRFITKIEKILTRLKIIQPLFMISVATRR